MILTPTFHVHEMHLNHQDAQLVRSKVETPSYEVQEGGRRRTRDAVNISASVRGKNLLLTAVNEHLEKDLEYEITVRGASPRSARGRRLWSRNVRDHNTFDNPDLVKPTSFTPSLRGGRLHVELPAHSVNSIEIDL